APPPLPVRPLVPVRRAELPRAHDLGADARIVKADKGVVDPAGAAGLTLHLVPPARLEHPFVEPLPSVAEGRREALAFAGAEAIKRDREELDAGKGHGRPPVS